MCPAEVLPQLQLPSLESWSGLFGENMTPRRPIVRMADGRNVVHLSGERWEGHHLMRPPGTKVDWNILGFR